MSFLTDFLKDAKLVAIAVLVLSLLISICVNFYQHLSIENLELKIQLNNLAVVKLKEDADARIKSAQTDEEDAWKKFGQLQKQMEKEPAINPALNCEQVRLWLIMKAKELSYDK